MRGIVLVGGQGTRLRPLTLTTPKQLLPIAELTMIERVFQQLAAHGVDDLVLSMGYKPDGFFERFPDGRAGDVRLTYAVEPEPLDTAGAVGYAARYAGIDETFVVVNGDVLTDFDIGALIDLHKARGAEATISLTPVEDPSAFGVVPTDDQGRVQAFIEKPPRDEAPTNEINAGTYVLEPSVIELIPEGRRVSIERETFPLLVERESLYALASDTYWLDTGTPEKYLQANLDLINGRRKLRPTPTAHENIPGVWQEGETTIEGHIEAPAFLGTGASIAETAVVTDSIIGAGAHVEAGATVTDSVILPHAVIASSAVVERSIVGARAKVQDSATLREFTVVGDGAEVPAGSTHTAARIPDSD